MVDLWGDGTLPYCHAAKVITYTTLYANLDGFVIDKPRILWQPTELEAQGTELAHFMRAQGFDDYDGLWHWSVQHIEDFWEAIWRWFEIKASKPYRCVLGTRDMPGAEWFPECELSYAEHVFRRHADEAVAMVHMSEIRPLAVTTWGELRAQTAAIRAALIDRGVVRGDRIAAYMPNVPETAAAFLATASIGAIWSAASPDFGAQAVADRFAQIGPKVLFATDGYRYRGRDFDRTDSIRHLQHDLPTIEHTFVLPYLGVEGNWGELERSDAELEFAQLPFNHPLWILYSSGTTGRPKPIVHSQGGILLEHLKTMRLHFDLRQGDRMFWFTTTGWMMWNLLVSALLTDAAIVLYDGDPASPDLGRLWDIAEETGMTCFGTSAAYISACMKEKIKPGAGRDLSRLRSIGSTGSPLSSESYQWIYDQLGEKIWLFSTSGGTDVATAFVGGVPTLPVYEGELQARCLGAKVEAFDESGNSLVDLVGELVVTEPMPSMPICFWGDHDGDLYRSSYFEMYPGVWRHGDWIEITTRGTAIISGRSDSTINRGGVRMGTSEIYRVVLGVDQVVDALVVDADGYMPLFVVLRDGVDLDPGLRGLIARRLRDDCSPRHVPSEIHAVPQIPRTLSGKVLEVPVKRILMGADPKIVASPDSLANPASLDWFFEWNRQRAEREPT
jgi:acetoacetyl-CoA synthetase